MSVDDRATSAHRMSGKDDPAAGSLTQGELCHLVENAGEIVWTVDMYMRPTYVSASIERHLGYTVQEACSLKMDELFAVHSYCLAMRVLANELRRDVDPDIDPDRTRLLEVDLVHKNGTLVPFEVVYSGIRDGSGTPCALMAVARNITSRREAEAYRVTVSKQIVTALEQTIQALALLGEMRDSYTAGHQRRVAGLVCALGRTMGLDDDTVTGLRLAGLIHDIGKVCVPAEILTRPGSLSSSEFAIIKTHPQVGYDVLSGIEFPWPIADVVLQHHERLNGSGYPCGLVGSEIILEARILAVADVVEAIGSNRPYRPALGMDRALQEIREQRGTLYDQSVVDACLALFDQGYRLEEQHSLSPLSGDSHA